MKKYIVFLMSCLMIFTFMPNEDSLAKQENKDYLITFKDSKNIESITSIGGEIIKNFEEIPVVKVKMSIERASILKNNPLIESVEEDGIVHTNSQTIPWGLPVIYENKIPKSKQTGRGVSVAVLDTGIKTTHEDLNIAGGKSFVDGINSFEDDNGHGTHVAGVIGASDNEVGVVGVAPNVELYSVKVLNSEGDGKYSDIISGLEWVIKNNIQVVNMSFGSAIESKESKAFEKALKEVYKNNIVLVSSAGNTGDIENKKGTITYPASSSSVIAVGAIDPNHYRFYFSSYGKELELMAPGVSIYSTSLEGYSYKSGTSLASPYVAGIAALMLEEDPSMDPKAMRKKMQDTATPLGDPVYNGYGLVNAYEAMK